MKQRLLLTTLGPLIFAAMAWPAQAQVSFFQPPTYIGNGAVFVADFNGDGKPDILTSDGTMNLGKGDGTFAQGTTVSGTVLAVSDFNGDGKPDVLEQGTGSLLVLLGNGDGTFQAPINTASGASLSPVAATDLNGDGKADVMGLFNNNLTVYLSNGDGTFKPGVSYSLGVTAAGLTISFGNFVGSGKIDVAVLTSGAGYLAPGPVVVLPNNGDGTFQTPKISAGLYPASVVVGDFNGDGKLDLAVDNYASVYILTGNGDGTFQAPTLVFSSVGVLVAVDFNGDGRLDLAVESGSVALDILLGNGDGTFSNRSNYLLCLPILQTGTPNTGMAVADFNSDGKVDVAGCSAILLGDGNGAFQGWQLSVLPEGAFLSVIGDFDKNGSTDVATISGNTSLFILNNDGTGSLTLTHSYALQQQGYGVVTADFNGDGNLDLAVVGLDAIFQTWSYTVLLGNGDGSFQSPVFYSQSVIGSYGSISIVVADFNNDHKPDLAVSGVGSQSFAVLLGNGDGTFAAPVYYYNLGFSPLLVGDFNGDGRLDIAAGGTDMSTSPPTQKTAILFGNGDGTFQAAVFPASLNGFSAAFTADLNNDGRPDLISANQAALGIGNGTFTLLPSLSCQPFTCQLDAVSDMNGDGRPDLFVTQVLDHPIQTGILLGNGDGTFGPFIPVPATGLIPVPTLIADMNGDGRPDLTFGWLYYKSGIGVILNATPAGFELSATTLSPGTVTAGDFATSTIMATRMFGFNGTVTLSCAGLPSGANCGFSPTSIANSSGTSSLSITTATSTAAGTYLVEVQGSSGSVASSMLLSLVVQARPDFTIGPASGSPTSQTISAGQAASFTLAFAGTGSFTGTVNLSCSIMPAVTPPATCSLPSSVQISGSGTQSLIVKVGTIGSVTTGAALNVRFPAGAMRLAGTLVVLGLGGLLLRGSKPLAALSTLMVVMGLALSVSCGGSSSTHTTPGTPSGTYTATVTASSASLNHDIALTVVVQ